MNDLELARFEATWGKIDWNQFNGKDAKGPAIRRFADSSPRPLPGVVEDFCPSSKHDISNGVSLRLSLL